MGHGSAVFHVGSDVPEDGGIEQSGRRVMSGQSVGDDRPGMSPCAQCGDTVTNSKVADDTLMSRQLVSSAGLPVRTHCTRCKNVRLASARSAMQCGPVVVASISLVMVDSSSSMSMSRPAGLAVTLTATTTTFAIQGGLTWVAATTRHFAERPGRHGGFNGRGTTGTSSLPTIDQPCEPAISAHGVHVLNGADGIAQFGKAVMTGNAGSDGF